MSQPRNPAPPVTMVASYERPFVPFAFDVLISTIFIPFGGIRKLRSDALDRIGVKPGTRVLELACGTGGITKLLLERGAEVTAIDGAEHMLVRARKRALGAKFAQSPLEDFEPTDRFDVVLFAFVLHELPKDLRVRVLNAGRRALMPEGTLAVLDHAAPRSGSVGRAWRRFLLRLEPTTVRDCIEAGYDAELEAAGLEVTERHSLAGGTAALTLARMPN
jgi:ubiquinone/menaquinone biosynthesis C-methylase UbiE